MYALLDRKMAAHKRLKHYFTGVPCAKGHLARRYTSTGNCTTCNAEATRKFQQRLETGQQSVYARVTLPVPRGDTALIKNLAQLLCACREGQLPPEHWGKVFAIMLDAPAVNEMWQRITRT